MLWFFVKPVSNFDNLSSMKLSICVYMALSMIFVGAWGKALTGLWCSLSKPSFFLGIGVTSAAFSSSGGHPFRVDELMVLLGEGHEHRLWILTFTFTF